MLIGGDVPESLGLRKLHIEALTVHRADARADRKWNTTIASVHPDVTGAVVVMLSLCGQLLLAVVRDWLCNEPDNIQFYANDLAVLGSSVVNLKTGQKITAIGAIFLSCTPGAIALHSALRHARLS